MDHVDEMLAEVNRAFSVENSKEVDQANPQFFANTVGDQYDRNRCAFKEARQVSFDLFVAEIPPQR